MTALAHHPTSLASPCSPGRGDVVYPAYWIAATALIVATLFGVPLGQPAAVAVATLVFIGRRAAARGV